MSARSLRQPLLLVLVLVLASVSLLPGAASASTITGYLPRQAQTAQLRPHKVAIQIGHYKNNELPSELSRLIGSTGTYGGGRSELSVNLDIGNRVAALLRAQGITVEVLPATVPTGYTADAFVAIHADGNSSPTARGFKISTRWRSEVAVQDAMLVEMLTESYRLATGLPEDNGVTRNMRGYYAYASWRPNWRTSNFTPGAIVEMGFMTHPADREVMFKIPDKVAQGIARGIVDFLKAAYGSPRGNRPYGQGVLDDDIDPTAAAFPHRSNTPPSRTQRGDWRLYLMGKALVNVHAQAGGAGGVIAQLPRGKFHRSTLRQGDYYQVTLTDGRPGWIHRNAVVVQM